MQLVVKAKNISSVPVYIDYMGVWIQPSEEYLMSDFFRVEEIWSNPFLPGLVTDGYLIFGDESGFKTQKQSLRMLSPVVMNNDMFVRNLSNFIAEGPTDGFASGAYKETLPAGNPFPTSITWWESAAKNKKIIQLTITRNTKKMPVTEEWVVYESDGTTIASKVTDSYSYFRGVFETNRTRTVE